MSTEERQKLIADLSKRYPESTLQVLEDFKTISEYIPTGSVSLDRSLYTPGLPLGRVVELVGMNGSGKTTLAMSVMAQAQLRGYTCLFVDMEFTFNKEFAVEVLGVQEDKSIIAHPSSGEEAIGIMEACIEANAVKVIVLDSVPAFNPTEELTKSIDDPSQIGNHARFINRLMKRIVPKCGAKDILFIAINQPRDVIGAYAGTTETGGRALKCWKSISIALKVGKKIEDKGNVVGQNIEYNIKKSKYGGQFAQGSFSLRWAGESLGIDNISDMIMLASSGGIIKENRGWYALGDLNLRLKDMREFLMSNPDVYEDLVKQCFGDS
jgi:recombination protein RecA